MCFGGGGNKNPPPAAPTAPGAVDVGKVAPSADPAAAKVYRGQPVGPNESGRYGGGLLVDAGDKARKARATLG